MKRSLFPLLALLLMLCVGSALAAEMPDGVYAPESFSFSGGSGKVEITCPEVTLKNGEAIARIVFSSPNYPRVMMNGVEYTGEHTEGTSIFEVPVPLNASFLLTGTTTAMSRPHDVEYTLRIGLGGESSGPELPGLQYASSLTLSRAEGFTVDIYEGGYALIRIAEGGSFLAIPEGMPAPEGLPSEITVLQKPLDNIYLAATSVMSLISRLDALDAVRFSGTRAEGWYVESAADRMRAGSMLFAGKYSEPDYELLIREGCDLAIESTMILHTPKVQELLELLGIPVLIDRSSYEPDPLGRLEWIRLYGILLDRVVEADAFFAAQEEAVEALSASPESGASIAFFYIGTDGQAVVRGAADYIVRMMEAGGGIYALAGLSDPENSRAAVSVTMEDFYAAALDADYLIYNASIDRTVTDLNALMAKSPLFTDFRAVREGNVWSTGQDLYQATDGIADFIGDISRMLRGQEDGMVFLRRLK